MLLLVASAGCVGDADGVDEEDAVRSAADPGAADAAAGAAADRTALSFPFRSTVGNATVWANGSYAVDEHHYPVFHAPMMAGIGEPTPRFVDITDMVPPGGPVNVVAEVQAQTRSGEFPQGGDVDLWLEAGSGDFLGGQWDSPYGGYTRFDAWVQAASGAPIQVGLLYDELDPSTGFDYTLRVDVRVALDVFPPGIAAAVQLEAGDNLTLETDGEVLVFDPRDRHLGAFQPGSFLSVGEAQAGEYVFVPQDAPLRLLAAGGAGSERTMRLLADQWLEGGVHDLGATTTWTFDVAVHPLTVGLRVYSAEELTYCPGLSGELSGPEGVLIEMGFQDPTCAGPGAFDAWWETGPGPGVVPGTYQVTLEAPDSLGLRAQEWVLTYAR